MEQTVGRYEIQTSHGVVVDRQDVIRDAFRAALKAPRSLFVHDTEAPKGKPTLYDAQGRPVGWVPRPAKA